MKIIFYREVHLFCKGGHCNEGDLLLSFEASFSKEVPDSEGMSRFLSSREYFPGSCLLFSRYIASCFVEGQSTRLVLTREEKDPLTFVRASPKADWVFIQDEAEKLISPRGNHSLNLLVFEFTRRAT